MSQPGVDRPNTLAGPGLTMRLGLAFVGFVVAGSLLLLAWFGHQQRRQSEELFVALAKADAEFIREMHLPRSEKLASDLRRLLKTDVYFRDRNGAITPHPPAAIEKELSQLPADAKPAKAPGNRQALVVAIDEQHDAVFVRDAVASAASLTQPSTLGALGVFGLLSLGLAWAVARDVVRPISQLAKRLPLIFAERAPDVPEVARRDEIGQLARSLIQAKEQLTTEREKRERAERLALLGRVATGLAHEIKNPVASIRLHSQLMDHGALDAGAKRSLALIHGESQVIESLVNQWLFLAKPEPPKMSPLDVREVLRQTIQTISTQAAHAGVTVQTRLNDPMPMQGDRQRLAQAFRNLAVNAIQAMPTGGDLMIDGAVTDGRIQITFADTGPGFSNQALERGADLFFSEREGGLGIGLNVAKEVITHHGGRIDLANAATRGARITISLSASP